MHQEMNYRNDEIMDLVRLIHMNEQKLNCMLHSLDTELMNGHDVSNLVSEITDQCLNCNIAVFNVIYKINLDVSLQMLDPEMEPDEIIQVSLNNIHIIKNIGMQYCIS